MSNRQGQALWQTSHKPRWGRRRTGVCKCVEGCGRAVSPTHPVCLACAEKKAAAAVETNADSGATL